MQTIYIEKHLLEHPRAKRILEKFTKKTVITCNHYGEVFNRKNQNFRQQKQNPSLIIAEKKGKKVLPTPPEFGIGGKLNYYFSHLLNCPFDCRYCFLQGMYQSAHYVLFINYEDFMTEIKNTINNTSETCYFFSGYDSDSLAYDPISYFTQEFIPFFSQLNNCYLELRTKSANIRPLLKHEAPDNCIVAFSLNPSSIADKIEHKAASTSKRLKAMQQLAQHGYTIGLRFDPLIYTENFEAVYRDLFMDIKKHLNVNSIHSISIGGLRFPSKMHDKLIKLYPESTLLHQARYPVGKNKSYKKTVEQHLIKTITEAVKEYFPNSTLFSCANNS